ncbi:MAG: nitronate monooxygenase [Deltaproteobacteria bacterium]|jgi:enoyl-[acyl-carrier protein] reductase II|nr:nitronate monooxygenase [Deltaproteobacteria bacterium]MBW2531920.1 nitronate monooxygenase [Deltaproteobacteria bacterium]
MKTKITALFDIEYPIVLSGMSWISTPPLVAAVAEAGGLGILATGVCHPDQSREYIRETRRLTDKPFAANVTLYFPESKKNASVLIEEKVPVVNYSLGKGDWIAEAVHAYGGKVIATVTTAKHALAAQRDGADAIIATGHEAAAHGGDVSSLVLVPRLADLVDIPVIAAGGFADGRGLAAALALGAEGISMGTRFMNCQESPVHQGQKEISNAKDIHDTLYTERVDGLPARFLRAAGSKRMMGRQINPATALINSRRIADMLGMSWAKIFAGILLAGPKKATQMARMAIAFEAFEAGTMAGDNERGVLPLGQVTGLIDDTPTVEQIVSRLVEGAEQATKRATTALSS